jgi:hypothetical protein
MCSTSSENAVYSEFICTINRHPDACKLSLALTGCNGKNAGKPGLVADAGFAHGVDRGRYRR